MSDNCFESSILWYSIFPPGLLQKAPRCHSILSASLRLTPPFTSPLRPPPRLLHRLAATMHSSPSSSPQQPSSSSSSSSSSDNSSLDPISYHNQTKHSLSSGFARGPRGLDWANQPNPFLRFLSSPLLPLLHSPPPPLSPPLYSSLFSSSPPAAPPHPLSLHSLSRLLYHSLALSAWKSSPSSTWPLRVNPSSGNLHPTEAHLLSPPLPSLSPLPFLAHYSPRRHALHLRARLPRSPFPNFDHSSSLLLCLSSVLWREAWKYGERAFRYCNHDVGHAIAAVVVAAAALGWDVRLLDGLGHDDLHHFLGLDFNKSSWIESQHPDCLLVIFPFGAPPKVDYGTLGEAFAGFDSLDWMGSPDSLSKEHVCWDVVYRVAEAVKKPRAAGEEVFDVNPLRPSGLISEKFYEGVSAREVVRKRRSAVEMDGVHAMERDCFYQILLHCLPSGRLGPGEKQGKQLALPFRTMTWDAQVHAALFVHRVKDLPQGLYFLVRNEEQFDRLKMAMSSEFEWAMPEGCPDGLPLYRLAMGNCVELAKRLSCHQDIAADGCFSLGMIAHFEPVLRENNAWMYPRLFWETGVLGQMLYLEAHAVGISATGIGCYFDDDVHKVLGLKGLEYQSLYHFTIGSPVLDKRIMSLPPYPGPDA